MIVYIIQNSLCSLSLSLAFAFRPFLPRPSISLCLIRLPALTSRIHRLIRLFSISFVCPRARSLPFIRILNMEIVWSTFCPECIHFITLNVTHAYTHISIFIWIFSALFLANRELTDTSKSGTHYITFVWILYKGRREREREWHTHTHTNKSEQGLATFAEYTQK